MNHDYGFGRLDIAAAIETARHWEMLHPGPMAQAQQRVDVAIPDNDQTGVARHLEISSPLAVEFVEVVFDAPDHGRLGDLEIVLTSPCGTRSVLAERHTQRFEVFRYDNWRFGTLRHLGEPANGSWSLRVRDLREGQTGNWLKWSLRIHGYDAGGGETSRAAAVANVRRAFGERVQSARAVASQ